MDKNQVIEHLCETTALVYHSIGDYSEPSDGFCQTCPFSDTDSFQHSGKTLRYIRQAVADKLKADGFTISEGFNSETGDPLPKGGDQ